MDKISLSEKVDKLCEICAIEKEYYTRDKTRIPLKFPKNMYCSKCKTTTHMTRNCRSKRTTSNNREFGLCTVVEPLPTKPIPKINVEVEKKQIEALLDTGATTSLITKELAEKLRLTTTALEESRNLSGIGGNSKIEKSAEFYASIQPIPFTKFKIQVFIIDKSPYQLILGTDFLSKHKVDFSFSNGSISIGPYQI